jgi:ubiquinone/menaquinone biosynthesis C-methylase UbiE
VTSVLQTAAPPRHRGSKKLQLLPYRSYQRPNHNEDPIRLYYVPVIGRMYRRRVEMCLAECTGGARVLEVGFGSGVSFLNLNEIYGEIHGIDLTCDHQDVARAFRDRGIETYLREGNVCQLPYPDNFFDTVILVSILEHLKPEEQDNAFAEIRRVLRPGGQVVYGVPVEKPMMVVAFRCLGYNIRNHHFSTERQVSEAASRWLSKVKISAMKTFVPFAGSVYEVGHFVKKN